MKVLVTGGTGLIGSHAIAALTEAGHEVRALVRNADKLRAVMAAHGIEVGDLVQGDIVDGRSVDRALGGVDAVVHAAATVGLERKDASRVFETNVAGVKNVLGGAASRELDPIIYTSSISALSRPHGSAIDLDTPVVRPTMGYQASKSVAEHVARAMQRVGHPIVILYPGGVAGPLDPTLGPLFTSIRDQANRGFMLQTEGGVSVVDVRDIAATIVKLMRSGGGPRRYLMGGTLVELPRLRQVLEAALGTRLRPLYVPGPLLRTIGRLGDAVKRVHDFDFPMTHEAMSALTRAVPTDDSHTWDELGIEPRPVDQTLRDMLSWMVRHGHIEPERAPALPESGR